MSNETTTPAARDERKTPEFLTNELREVGAEAVRRAVEDQCYGVETQKIVYAEAVMLRVARDADEIIEEWKQRAALAESELAEVREQLEDNLQLSGQRGSKIAKQAAEIDELRAELERVKAENVYVPIPYGWTVRRLHPEDGVAFVIGTPRVDGVSSHTAVWSDAESPEEALLALMLDTHPADIGTEKVLIGYLKPGALEIMKLMPDEWVGGAKLKRDSDSRYTVPVYAAIGAGEGEAG